MHNCTCTVCIKIWHVKQDSGHYFLTIAQTPYFGHTINRAASASRNWRLLDGDCVVGVNVEKDFGDERIENGGVDHVIHQHCSDALKAKDNEFDLTEKVVVSRMHAV